jgi:FkbM family methyltransferase
MYQSHGWWFPDQDTHFAGMLHKNIKKGGGAVYQEPVRQRSIALTAHKGLAIDIGANVGLWCRDLCQCFDQVIAFEPVADFRACLQRNVPYANLEIKHCALGDEDTMIDMNITPENTGHSHVNPDTKGLGSIPMYRLDTLNLPHFDYCKIDCEGFEYTILCGAEQTIRAYRPVMVVEQKLHKDTGVTKATQYGAVELLRSWGAKELDRVRSDVILGWS